MDDVIARLEGALSGRYRIEREIGAGGMATVFLAHDLKHDRKVAVKVLKPELAAVVGSERFLAEIRTTANLQHPHILPLFDSGEADGFLFFVMPYVEGESLRGRLDREKQLPVEEAVRIATEVADALAHAHAKGVIHRDIKPANILLRDGRVQVADFGIALAVQQAGGARLTETGLSVGTPHYMSPEQASGDRELDGRSDVYSLGCVLYEVLAGEPPYTGATAQSVLAKILTDEPRPLSQLRRSVPPHVEAAVHKALEKLPADRWTAGTDFRAAVLRSGSEAPSFTSRLDAHGPTRRQVHVARVFGVVGLFALGASLLLWIRPRDPGPPSVLRFRDDLPLAEMRRQEARFALSPDARQIAMVVSDEAGGSHIELRTRDELESHPVPGTEGALGVFFSPDGSKLGFISDDPEQPAPEPGGGLDPRNALKVVRPGEVPATIASITGGIYGGIGGAWARDDWIYVAGPGLKVVRRYRADGTGQEDITTLDTLAGEWWQAWPQPLPDRRGVLFTVRMRSAEYRIGVASLDGTIHRLLGLGLQARVTPDEQILIAAADGTLSAYPFDLDRLRLAGPALPVARGLRIGSLAAVNLVMADNGTLAYESVESGDLLELGWVTRYGAFEPLDPPIVGVIQDFTLAPDGIRLALTEIRQERPDVWIRDLEKGLVQRLTSTGGSVPRWLPDGSTVSFRDPSGSPATGVPLSVLFLQKADGSSPPQPAFEDRTRYTDGSWSPSGWFAHQELENIVAVLPGRDSSEITVDATPATECGPSFSPDGRWIAYTSDESGQPDVYVRPFPEVGGGRWKVSSSGGSEAVWDPGGHGLFYVDLDGVVWEAEVRADASFDVTQRVRLFDTRPWRTGTTCGTGYAVSPQDGRFLMARPMTRSHQGRVVFVEGFSYELLERLGR